MGNSKIFLNRISKFNHMNQNESEIKATLKNFIASYFDSFGKEPVSDTDDSKMIMRACAFSDAIIDKLVRRPALFDELLSSPFLKCVKSKKDMQGEISKLLNDVGKSDLDGFKRAIRMYKYAELTRIFIKDFNSIGNYEAILAEWSDLADTIMSAAYDFSLLTLARKYGLAFIPQNGVVLGLGKLGGRELNYSSDVDLIVIYRRSEKLFISAIIDEHEFYVKLVSDMSNILSDVTEDGFAFRVDHDLRPEGKSGTLANSIDAAEHYYIYFAHDWEKQAMIRARPVAGDVEIGNSFLHSIMPLIYPKSVGMDDFLSMRVMKKKAERACLRDSNLRDVKLGIGGIREVEFLVQSLQRLYAGKYPKLISTNTFDALNAIASVGILHVNSVRNFKDAYKFLRRVENMIQIKDDTQRHVLPTSKRDISLLARSLGMPSRDLFERHYLKYTSYIAGMFKSLFESDYEYQEMDAASFANFVACEDMEEKIDSIAWFVERETRRIKALDMAGKISRRNVGRRLSILAEVSLKRAFELSYSEMKLKYSEPQNSLGNDAGFAIIGMGGLGAGDMDYGSDVDICFLYSGAGFTSGDNSISNVEFFTKLAQRTISAISSPTRYGRAYEVDSDLRPSGQQGALVATEQSFIEYHKSNADIWERMSIMKARTILVFGYFEQNLDKVISDIAFLSSAPSEDEVRNEINALRKKRILEKCVGDSKCINIKNGHGGLVDLDVIIQFLQVLHSSGYPSLRVQNMFGALDALFEEKIIDEPTCRILLESRLFFKTLISNLRLMLGRNANYINPSGGYVDALANAMKFNSRKIFLDETTSKMAAVEAIFDAIINN